MASEEIVVNMLITCYSYVRQIPKIFVLKCILRCFELVSRLSVPFVEQGALMSPNLRGMLEDLVASCVCRSI